MENQEQIMGRRRCVESKAVPVVCNRPAEPSYGEGGGYGRMAG